MFENPWNDRENTRATLVALFLLVAGVATVATAFDVAHADVFIPPQAQLQWSPLPEGAVELAREQARSAPGPAGDWEANEKVTKVEQGRLAEGVHALRGLNPWDDDSCHYARGNTLILHVFIDHLDATWSQAERDWAASKAQAAKEWYLDEAPYEANLRFDSAGGTGYSWIPVSLDMTILEMDDTIIEQAINALGFTNDDGDYNSFDEFTLAYQDAGSGWDNVIAVFQPANLFGRAFAFYSYGVAVQYVDDDFWVWRHEWGHCFGSCDEYVEEGTCNGGMDCGSCQSKYLDEVWNNGNCELGSCPSDVPCVMRDNVDAICEYTRNHWGWVDEDSNGVLDSVKRRDDLEFDWITELEHRSPVLSNNTEDGWAMAHQWAGWSVVGLRNPSDADYDLHVFNDNNHNYARESSVADGSVVDLVVSDFHFAERGVDHVQVFRDSGASSNYRIGWDSGLDHLYPSGTTAFHDWAGADVVRVWEVPLIAGEVLEFRVDPGASLDVGMMLYEPNPSDMFRTRTGAAWVADAGGGGFEESYYYSVPSSGNYGLVIYANNAVTTTISTMIGPTPTVLFEESPVLEDDPLHLFVFAPNDAWAAIGARKSSAADDVRIAWYEDYTYTNQLVEADDNEGVEFAVGLRPDADAGLARVYKEGPPTSNYRIEWDLAEVSTGYQFSTWSLDDVLRVWPVDLDQGRAYFFRQYNATGGTGFDAGLHLFRTDLDEEHFSRSGQVDGSNDHGTADEGEWFTYFNQAGGSHALVMTSEVAVQEVSGLWWGPLESPLDNETRTESAGVLFTRSEEEQGWVIAAARPGPIPGGDVDLFLMNDATYADIRTASYNSGEANFCVGFNSRTERTVYPRLRSNGARQYQHEWQTPEANLDIGEGPIDIELSFTGSEVVNFFTVTVPVPEGLYRILDFEVEDTSGELDLGVAIYQTDESLFYANYDGANQLHNATGQGGTEAFSHYVADSATVALVVFNENHHEGTYQLRIYDDESSGLEDAAIPREFSIALRSPNPMGDQAQFELALPAAGAAEIGIYQADGSRVRLLLEEEMPAGVHRFDWDGRDDFGRETPAGVYFTRATSAQGTGGFKLVRVR